MTGLPPERRNELKPISRLMLAGALTLGVVSTFAPDATADGGRREKGIGFSGAAYTATNDAQHNRVIVFRRATTGSLVRYRSFRTGGAGTGAGLGNQGGVTLDAEGRRLFVVNAGSDTVSVFRVAGYGLSLLDVESSGGAQPISVTSHGDLLYVLNAGDASQNANISGFALSPHGSLEHLAGSTHDLPGSVAGPAQIGFSPEGRRLVVTGKGTNNIVTYAVGDDGIAADPVVTTSEGTTPFGFSFSPRGRLLVSEAAGGAAGMSSVSSYEIALDGSLQAVTSALMTEQSAACWLVATRDGRYAYVTNTGSNTVTGLGVARNGALSLLDDDGVTAGSGSRPIDAALSRDGRYLYVLGGGDGSMSVYRVRPNGVLVPLGGVHGLPEGTNGLAAQ
jgi:6-phosphogluconolactonase